MRVLLVDDDGLGRRSVAKFLGAYLNHEVVEAESAEEGWKIYEENPFPLVISDIRMPGIDGIELLRKIKEHKDGKSTNVIIVTGFGELDTAVGALRSGAFDYLQKPINVEELAEVIKHGVEYQESIEKREIEVESRELNEIDLDSSVKSNPSYKELEGLGRIGIFSNSMKRIKSLTDRFHDDRDISVLIQGETGTGKEVIARMIHYGEERVNTPFVTVNCSAISPTLFESELFGYERGSFTGAKSEGHAGKLEAAQGGTIFLDEIGDLPIDMQPKLLRAIQMREVYRIGGKERIDLDVRFVSATNRDLESMVEKGSFRRDLYFRLNTGQVTIPPLKDRREEILPLAQLFLQQTSQKKNRKFRIISSEAAKILENHNWKGNVRELQNSIERVVLLNDGIELLPDHLDFLRSSDDIDLSTKRKLTIDLPENSFPYGELEREIINQLLKRFGGNKSKTAEYLGITRNRLNRKL